VAGVDGHINAKASIYLGSNRGMVWWLGIQTTSISYWVQAGQLQGAPGYWAFDLANRGSVSAIKSYWENNGVCGYTGYVVGAPSAANYGYYVTYSSTAKPACYIGSTLTYAYPAYVRMGSYTSAPIGTQWLPSGGYFWPQSVTEVVSNQNVDMPSVYPAYFGLTDNHTSSSSYALHADIHGVWQPWNSTSVPSTSGGTAGSPAGLVYHHLGGATDFGQFYTSN
jgi:hypothetical protein